MNYRFVTIHIESDDLFVSRHYSDLHLPQFQLEPDSLIAMLMNSTWTDFAVKFSGEIIPRRFRFLLPNKYLTPMNSPDE